jgi:hypothetical protein
MIYISTKGQWFGRFAPRQSGKGHESIGTSGTHDSSGGGPREVQFSGRSTIVTGAVAFLAEPPSNLTKASPTCDAQLIFAKEAGRDVVVGNNLDTGAADKEIRSVTISNVSCSVRDGNVFAQ